MVKKIVNVWATLDERFADGFYFTKSIKMIEWISGNPELLKEKLSKKIDFDI